MDFPILTLLIWLPIFGAALLLLIGDRDAKAAQRVAALFSLLTLALSLWLWSAFDSKNSALQFTESFVWIKEFSIHYALGIDGLALPLIVLTALITPLVVFSAGSVSRNVGQYLAAFLLLEGLMIGVFAATDAVLFYIFFEAMLIPMFLIIGIWGGPRRVYATIKFFLYTFLGSVFMLVAFLYLYLESGSFAIADWQAFAPIALPVQIALFVAFFLAFAVKIPMVPVHTWLPDAHVEAPTGGSVILAAIMLKIGGYGFLRFNLPITPDAAEFLQWWLIGLSLLAIVYIGLVALAQSDMKKLIAYSSIAHMGFVTLGIFLVFLILPNHAQGAELAVSGAMVQMISHGLVSAALFFCVGVLYDRVHSREISAYGGVAHTMPTFAAFMVLFAMANVGLPGTSGFVGEFMVIIAAMKANFWIAFAAATTLIFAAAYTLWLIKRVIFGEANPALATHPDVSAREYSVLLILALLVVALGVYPAPLLEVVSPAVAALLEAVAESKLPLLNVSN